MLTDAVAEPSQTVHCGVWGSPISHSLSPVLHSAAYAALGLSGWVYDRREVDAAEFPAALRALDRSWRGLSLTMPLKEVALAAAAHTSEVAASTGAANTLVRGAGSPGGTADEQDWIAENTDVDGIVAAVQEIGGLEVGGREFSVNSPRTALVIGSGATARSAVAALARLGVERVHFMVRGSVRPETARQARAAGLDVDVLTMGDWPRADLVVSTVPSGSVPALDRLGDVAPHGAALLEVVYGSGMTPLQEAGRRLGWQVIDGTRMLLHQAARQVELMTGCPPPLAEMDEALRVALAARG